jgi:membrane fusion protein, copper/silver efflux system
VRSLEHAQQQGWECLRVTVAIEKPARELCAGMIALAHFKFPIADLEPFRSLPADPPPLAAQEPRAVYVCPDHPDQLALKAGRCPIDGKRLVLRSLADHQRLRWWCPMHASVTADRPGAKCPECGGMPLAPRVVSFNPRGAVLSVPQSAVVDTGTRKVVFVEGMPGMFDGREVLLGPRCGDFYPVVRGLEAGERVVTAGAFLLDAETRLNPALASAYFGAARSQSLAALAAPAGSAGSQPAAEDPLSWLSSEDRARAQAQRICPVTGKALGSMGAPARVVISGRTVFLCCHGCEERLQREPGKYLAKLPGVKRP